MAPRGRQARQVPTTSCSTGSAIRFTDGYTAGANLIKQALRAYRDHDPTTIDDLRWPGIARRIAPELLDDESWHDVVTSSVQLARSRGALGVLPIALSNLALLRIFEGKMQSSHAPPRRGRRDR